MAKIKLTKKNFSKYLLDKMGDKSSELCFLKLLGVTEDAIKQVDTEDVTINTDKILLVSPVVTAKETEELVFYIIFDTPVEKFAQMWFDAEGYDRLMSVWLTE